MQRETLISQDSEARSLSQMKMTLLHISLITRMDLMRSSRIPIGRDFIELETATKDEGGYFNRKTGFLQDEESRMWHRLRETGDF